MVEIEVTVADERDVHGLMRRLRSLFDSSEVTYDSGRKHVRVRARRHRAQHPGDGRSRGGRVPSLAAARARGVHGAPRGAGDPARRRGLRCSRADRRSEEHTSELQSLAYLVCRLLLEKKKRTPSAQSARPRTPPTPTSSRTMTPPPSR